MHTRRLGQLLGADTTDRGKDKDHARTDQLDPKRKNPGKGRDNRAKATSPHSHFDLREHNQYQDTSPRTTTPS